MDHLLDNHENYPNQDKNNQKLIKTSIPIWDYCLAAPKSTSLHPMLIAVYYADVDPEVTRNLLTKVNKQQKQTENWWNS